MNLQGKTALVVGAGRGIGRSVAEKFAEAGANVAISSRTEPELLELEYKIKTKCDAEVFSFTADAARADEVRELVSGTRERFGSIDIVVLAAGKGILKPFDELSDIELDELLDANLRTAFNVLKEVLPVMKEQRAGNVVAIPGVLGKAPMMQGAGYCAAKYALTGMIKCLKDEYRRFGIRFSLMHFGGVDSTFWDGITMKVDRSKMLTVDAAASSVCFAASQNGEGVMSEVVLLPESHQLI